MFAVVFLEQTGPPFPSGPLLIVAGARANEARVSALSIAGIGWIGGMTGKVALYVVGGRYGRQAMDALCRLAVTPDSSIGKADRHFERRGAALLILAEFIPGLRTLAPTLAGAEKLSAMPFLLYSALGAALWTTLYYLGIGLVFGKQIDRVNPCRAVRKSRARSDCDGDCCVLRRQMVEATKLAQGVELGLQTIGLREGPSTEARAMSHRQSFSVA